MAWSYEALLFVRRKPKAVSSNAIYLATVCEAAPLFVAHPFGNDTAWWLGRVSFNPSKPSVYSGPQ
jgi:hypothetical protein